MPIVLLFLMIVSGVLAAVYGAIMIAVGEIWNPLSGGLIVALGLAVAAIGARWAWSGEGPRRGPPTDDLPPPGAAP